VLNILILAGQRRRSAAARLLRLWVRIPPGAWMFTVVSVVCCQVEDLCCPPPDKKWISPPPLMIPRSNRRIKMRKLCTTNNSAKSSPTDIIIPDWNQYFYIKYYSTVYNCKINWKINTLNAELNPICYLLALLGTHHSLHVSRIRVKSLTLRLLMSYIYGAPILDVSRSHTTTHHSR